MNFSQLCNPSVRRLGFLLFIAANAADAGPPVDSDDDPEGFQFSSPVVCSEIKGYEDFEKRKNTSLTKYEKLLLYFRPTNFETEKVGKKYQAHFSEDVKIRRKGQKSVIWFRDKLADTKITNNEPPSLIYLRTSLSLKDLKPGDYEIEVILHDLVGKSKPFVRTLSIKVVEPSKDTADESDADVRKSDEPGSSSERPGSK